METLLVKKPEDREIVELIDAGHNYPSTGSSECTAPPGYRCPYRRYRTPPRTTARGEILTRGITPRRKGVVENVELIDLDSVYLEARSSECTAPPSYRCAYRQRNTSFPAANNGMLSLSESGLSQSQPLRLTPNGNRPGSGKRTEDLCRLAYSRNSSITPESRIRGSMDRWP
jgi:hypothetical protein